MSMTEFSELDGTYELLQSSSHVDAMLRELGEGMTSGSFQSFTIIRGLMQCDASLFMQAG